MLNIVISQLESKLGNLQMLKTRMEVWYNNDGNSLQLKNTLTSKINVGWPKKRGTHTYEDGTSLNWLICCCCWWCYDNVDSGLANNSSSLSLQLFNACAPIPERLWVPTVQPQQTAQQTCHMLLILQWTSIHILHLGPLRWTNWELN